MEFKDQLKSLRLKAGLTQRELAKRSGVSYSYLTKLESGVQINPTYEVLEAIGAVLKAPLGATYDFDALTDIKKGSPREVPDEDIVILEGLSDKDKKEIRYIVEYKRANNERSPN